MLTYPRTDSAACRKTTSPRSGNLTILTGEGAGKGHDEVLLARYSPFAHQILAATGCCPTSAFFNNAKISDHFAIIPTPQAQKPERRWNRSCTTSSCAASSVRLLPGRRIPGHHPHHPRRGEPSRPKARCWSIRAGWPCMAEGQAGDEGNLVAVAQKGKVKTDDTVRPTKPSRHRAIRKPPALRHGRAPARWSTTELKAAMAGRGLGTPATRAQIIENLIGEQYMHREGRELIPTAKAFSLMTCSAAWASTELTSRN